MGAVRLFLALVVVFDHGRDAILIPHHLNVNVAWALGLNAGYAVMFFYVISGFLIGYAINNKYGFSPDGAFAFYEGRFVRIFSLFWPLAVLLLLVSPEARQTLWQARSFDKFTGLCLFGVDWNMAFRDYPALHMGATLQDMTQSWTLGAELSFYALAPFLLRSKWAIAVVLLGSVTIRAIAFHRLGFNVIWTHLFFPATVLFFMLGAGANEVARRPLALRKRFLIFGLIACVGFLMFPEYAYWDTPRFWGAVLLFAVSLPALFDSTKDSRVLNILGDLSYPVYLVHLFVLAFLKKPELSDKILSLAGPYGVIGALLIVSLVTAVAAHYAIEVPMTRLMRAGIYRSEKLLRQRAAS